MSSRAPETESATRGIAGLSPEKLDRLVRQLRGLNRVRSSGAIARADRRRPAPLALAQERLWFLHRLAPESPAYHIAAELLLAGELSVRDLAASLAAVVARHEALRTGFVEGAGQALQKVADEVPVPLPEVDLRALPATRRAGEAERLAGQLVRRPFDLSAPPLLRAALLRTAEDRSSLMFVLHHIVADGWSSGILIRELAELYAARLAGRRPALPELPVQYLDFAVWQRQRLTAELLAQEVEHWRGELAGLEPLLALPTDRPRPAVLSSRGAQQPFAFAPRLAALVRHFSTSRGATPFVVLLAAWSGLLARWSRQTEIAVACPVANRNRAETEGLIGFFVNTLVMRCRLDGAPSLATAVTRIAAVAAGATAHQELPFERLVAELAPERSLSHGPLAQVALALDLSPPAAELPGLRWSVRPVDTGTAKFDLLLNVTAGVDGAISGFLEYNTELFDRPTQLRCLAQLESLLAAALVEPERPLRELPLLAAAERWQLLGEWNDTRSAPVAAPVAQDRLERLFAEQVRRRPDAVALLDRDGCCVSYGELDRWSTRLSRLLRARGVWPEDLVAVRLERSAALVAALWAVLKTGAAYVPLDPAYPHERTRLLLEDSGAALLVTEEALAHDFPRAHALVIGRSDDAPVHGQEGEREEENGPGMSGDGLAYLIYTSGSTGRPKAVGVRHASVVELVRWSEGLFPAEDLAGVLAATSVCFDLSIFELFVPLCRGGRVILAADALELVTLPAATTVTLVNTVPSAMAELVRLQALPASVRTCNLAGEALSRELVLAIEALGVGCRVLNLYGPSEDTTYSTVSVVPRPLAGEPSIGRPLANTRAYVVEPGGQPAPVGVPGELCLGGAGLARGYLGRPDLTAERFLPDPYGAESGGRLYRTGDLARLRVDGQLEFLGRLDDQIKLRGFRIELGEIEAALLAHAGVREAAAVVRECGGEKHLVAYVVGEELAGLAEHLRRRLPEYMLPWAFVDLAALPRNANGKLERGRLPAPQRPVAGAHREAPRTPAEELLAGVWSEVLGLEEIGRHDNFFTLGGHSLAAVRVVSRLRELGIELPVRRIFERRTLADLAESLLAERAGEPEPPLAPRELPGPAPLSFAQERLWFLSRVDPESPLYNMSAAVRLTGPLDVAALVHALARTAARQEALRTTFVELPAGPVQRVAESTVEVPLPVVDLSALADEARGPAAWVLAGEQARAPFDLTGGALVRFLLLRLGGDVHLLVCVLHHTVADGGSVPVLVRDLGAAYAAGMADVDPAWPALAVQYADYALWQRRWLRDETLARLLAPWRQRLHDAPMVIELPSDRPRPAVQGARGGHLPVAWSAELHETVARLARREGATLNMALLAGLAGLLARFTGQEDLLLGIPVAGRNRRELEDLVGLFVDTLVLRLHPTPERGFATLLAEVRTASLEALSAPLVPFEKLVEDLRLERRLSHAPLVQVMLSLLPALEMPMFGELTTELLELATGTSKFDLSLLLTHGRSGLAGTLEYSCDLFDAVTPARWWRHLSALLANAAAAPARPIAELELLLEAERAQLLREWSGAAEPALRREPFSPVPAQVLSWGAETPDAVALVSEGLALTYQGLLYRAGQLAKRLVAMGVSFESIVAVCADRTPESVVAQLGIQLAGAAYLPLDPAHPADRLLFQLADCGARALLAPSRELERLASFAGAKLPIAQALGRATVNEDLQRLRQIDRDHLAYVVYTSGSTGRPKGVGVSHGALANLVRWHHEAFRVGASDRASLVSGPGFDAAVWETWPYLAAGASLLVPETEVRNSPQELLSWLARGEATLSFLPTPLAEVVLNEAVPEGLALRCLLTGGDLLHRGPRQGLPYVFYNQYGPTEGAVVATWCMVPAAEASPAIGRPIAGAVVYLLARGGLPVPVGVPGELWLGGAGLARGYLGRPDLTAERFLPDPYGVEPGGRLYRTGDLARFRGDGKIEFLGRVDHQVKVRGFRIELGEIEAALLAHSRVREAVATVREVAGEKRLVAYVVTVGQQGGDLEAVLRQRLPHYMVPWAVVELDALPYNANGKVDRNSLPTPEERREAVDREAPRTPLEELVAGVWMAVLGVDEVGTKEDFFLLGGQSLSAVRVVSRLRELLDREVPVRWVFEHRTVAGLAEALEAERADPALPPVVPQERRGPIPLSFAQERLWFLDRLAPGDPAYNIATAARLDGALDAARLAAGFHRVVARHESLRTAFATLAGRPVQLVRPDLRVPLVLVDLSALPDETARREAARWSRAEASLPFDLERPPLLRLRLLRLAPAEHLLLLTVHHIVCDGWSIDLLVRELAHFYRAVGDELAPLPVQYGDYALWQRGWLQREPRLEQLRYWTERLGPRPPVLDLPMDRERPPVQRPQAGHAALTLPADLQAGLRALGRLYGGTLFMVLLAAFKVLLQRWSGEDDIVVGTPTAGRVRRELEGLVGLFLNSLALRTDLSGDITVAGLLARVRETTLGAYSHQDLPVEKVIEALAPERHPARSPLFQVFFNLLSSGAREMELGGLTWVEVETPETGTKFDLTLYVREGEGGLRFDAVYNAGLFDAARIDDLLAQMHGLLAQFVAGPARRIGELSLLTARARAVLPDPALPLDGMWRGAVHEIFARRAQLHPERIAVVDPAGTMTYGELDRRCREVTRHLRAGGIGQGEVVAIYAHLSMPVVWAVIGTLASGAAFLMLDPAYPVARLVEIVEIARPAGWIEVAANGPVPPELEAARLRAGCRCRLVVERSAAGGADPAAAAAGRGVPVGPEDAAFLGFTSGSTGRPKGIVGRHGPLSHFIPWQCREFGLGPDDRFSMLSALAHDPLQRDIFTPLQIGGAIVIPDPAEIGRPGWLARWLGEQGVTVCHLTPAMGRLITEGAASGAAAALRYAFLVGDVLTRGDAHRLRRVAPESTCINLYGSTETQRAVGYHRVLREEEGLAGADGERAREILPLGRGMQDVQLLVLGPAGSLAGVGELGEIHVRSPHLARGYLDDPVLTALRFPAHPFSVGGPEDRVYRTGDLGRYLPNGEVSFAGRADQQAKIRGFRIELGEIEAVLKRHPAVRDVAVVVQEAGDRFLAAYLVAGGAARPEAGEIRVFLRRLLPEYMVPATYVWLAAIPLTPNRKVDRRALPVVRRQVTADPASLSSPLEEMIAGQFCDLLGLPQAGRETSFFDVGGHSVLAVELLSRLRDTCGVELPLRAIFEAPSIAALATEVEAARAGAAGLEASPLVARPRSLEVPLSYAQEHLWLLQRLAPEAAAFNLPSMLRLAGAVDEGALARALGEITNRHEALRTTFVECAGRPVQVLQPAADRPLPVVDLSSLPMPQAEGTRAAAAFARRPFDLVRGPLVAACLFRLGGEERRLALSLHHLVADGRSMRILANELAVLYETFKGGLASPLSALNVQYADYTLWQREWLEQRGLAASVAYWRRVLAGAPGALDLPTDRQRPAYPRYRGAHRFGLLPAELLARLRHLGRPHGATLFLVLLAAFDVLLARWSGEVDLVVGTPVANRGRREIEGLIGLFVNTLALRTDLADDPAFAGLLAQVRKTVLAAFDHRDLPFGRLVEELQPERTASRSPLFQVMLVLQEPAAPPPAPAGVVIEPLAVETGGAQFDLTLSLAETGRGLAYAWEYDADLFDATTVMRWESSFAALLAAAAAQPARRCSELALLSGAERAQLLDEWNDTAVEFPRQQALHQLFTDQARRTPERIALRALDGSLDYAELEARSARLSQRLREQGVTRGDRVGVFLRRSSDLVVALLAVLRAGAGYVPLDPAYPRERLRAILADAGEPLVLTEEALAGELSGSRAVTLAALRPELVARVEPEDEVGGDDLAYVIYTSGSTGRPKGVAIAHRGATDLLFWARTAFADEELGGLVAATSICFDLSVFEIFAPLAWGGTVLLADNALDLPNLPREWQPRLVNTVPSAMAELLRLDALPPSVVTVSLAGEALPRELTERLHATGTVRRVLNLYGPSEDTTYSTWARIDPGEPLPPGIGWPVHNTAAYVLDRWRNLAPLGAFGELYLGGENLAFGYLGRPDQTAERFLPDPFRNRPGARMYHTGDLVRRRRGGDLDFLGRSDHQIKLRGFRIELGDVEAALANLPGVAEAAATVMEVGGSPRLVACVAGGAELDPAALRQALAAVLPEYMVPAVLTQIGELPRTPNGKVDRRALPKPGAAAPQGVTPPRSADEEILAGIFAALVGRDRVGVEESFFELGGHSLLAAQVVSRVRELLGAELPLRALFETPTVAGLAEALTQVRGKGEALPPIPRRQRGGELPLSFAQQRLWLLDQMAPDGPLYNLATAVLLRGPLDAAALAAALGDLVRRHETLRTSFAGVEGQPHVRIAPVAGAVLPQVDLTALANGKRRAELRHLARAHARRRFDLARAPLWDAFLVRLAEYENALLLAMHHIVADGWSMEIFVSEAVRAYAGRLRGETEPLPELLVQYADFAAWQRDWLAGERLEVQVGYWRERLAGLPVVELPSDSPRPPVQSHRGATLRRRCSPALLDAVAAQARRMGATLYMVLLAGFQALVSRHAGLSDVAVGSPIAGRNRREVEELIGFFVNTLVLRADLGGSPLWSDLVARVRESALGAYAHQDLPFEHLVEKLQPRRDLSRNPLFQLMFNLLNTPVGHPATGELELEPLPVESGTALFDLQLYAAESPAGLDTAWEYARDLFDATTIARLAGHYETLLAAAVEQPEGRLSELSLLAPEERAQLLVEWNATARSFPPGFVHAAILERAMHQPGAVAVVCAGEALTYEELARRTHRLARRLRRLGVGPDVRVGVCVERSACMVVAVLGVLAAGGAYVPLDPAYPGERLRYMAADSGVEVLLTQRSSEGAFADFVGKRVRLASDGTFAGPEADTPPPGRELEPANLAYVIYTSGSTGRPKGVQVPHAALWNFLCSLLERPGLTASDVFVAVTSLSFDIAAVELYLPLLVGTKLVVATAAEVADGQRLGALLDAEQATAMQATPAGWRLLIEAGWEGRRSLKGICGGEALAPALARTLRQGTRELWNIYGPTETTIWSTIDPVLDEQVTIGRPIPNTRTYITDAGGQPAPVGVVGELWIAGDGVGRGYIGRPELTAEKFLPDPFGGMPGARLYSTGDLARWRADGRIDCFGRIDHQVKVRGFRIELGEIEAALVAHPGVAAAAVVAREEGIEGRRLVAYVVARGGESGGADLRAWLLRKLPEHMVPSIFVWLAALPTTPNGKIDRRALPAPEMAPAGVATAPQTPLEELVAGLFAEALGCRPLGRDEDFFTLGGHSLVVTQVAARLRSALSVDLGVQALFEHTTARGLAAYLEQLLAGGIRARRPLSVPAAPRTGRIPASFSQERLWFLHRLTPASPAYNLTIPLFLQGDLSLAALQAACGALVQRHEALRTVFAEIDGEPVQTIMPGAPLPWSLIDLSALPAARRSEESQRAARWAAGRSFDLTADILLRPVVLRLAADEHAALLTTHHMVADGWSLDVLVEDLAALYAAGVANRSLALPPPAAQYADFTLWQRGWLRGDAFTEQMAYWQERIAGAPSQTILPPDRPRPEQQTFRGAQLSFVWPPELCAAISDFCRRSRTTPFMALLAALKMLLYCHTRQDDLVLGAPISYRNWSEVERTVGFFVNTLVLRTDLSGDPDFAELAQRVRKVVLEATAHQDLPFNKLVGNLRLDRTLQHNPLFQMGFTYGVDRRTAPELPGLRLGKWPLAHETTQFDVNVTVVANGGGFAGSWQYSTDLFDRSTVASFMADYELVLRRVTAEPSLRLCSLLSEFAEAHRQRARAAGSRFGEASLDRLRTRRRPESMEPPQETNAAPERQNQNDR